MQHLVRIITNSRNGVNCVSKPIVFRTLTKGRYICYQINGYPARLSIEQWAYITKQNPATISSRLNKQKVKRYITAQVLGYEAILAS